MKKSVGFRDMCVGSSMRECWRRRSSVCVNLEKLARGSFIATSCGLSKSTLEIVESCQKRRIMSKQLESNIEAAYTSFPSLEVLRY